MKQKQLHKADCSVTCEILNQISAKQPLLYCRNHITQQLSQLKYIYCRKLSSSIPFARKSHEHQILSQSGNNCSWVIDDL